MEWPDDGRHGVVDIENSVSPQHKAPEPRQVSSIELMLNNIEKLSSVVRFQIEQSLTIEVE